MSSLETLNHLALTLDPSLLMDDLGLLLPDPWQRDDAPLDG